MHISIIARTSTGEAIPILALWYKSHSSYASEYCMGCQRASDYGHRR